MHRVSDLQYNDAGRNGPFDYMNDSRPQRSWRRQRNDRTRHYHERRYRPNNDNKYNANNIKSSNNSKNNTNKNNNSNNNNSNINNSNSSKNNNTNNNINSNSGRSFYQTRSRNNVYDEWIFLENKAINLVNYQQIGNLYNTPLENELQNVFNLFLEIDLNRISKDGSNDIKIMRVISSITDSMKYFEYNFELIVGYCKSLSKCCNLTQLKWTTNTLNSSVKFLIHLINTHWRFGSSMNANAMSQVLRALGRLLFERVSLLTIDNQMSTMETLLNLCENSSVCLIYYTLYRNSRRYQQLKAQQRENGTYVDSGIENRNGMLSQSFQLTLSDYRNVFDFLKRQFETRKKNKNNNNKNEKITIATTAATVAMSMANITLVQAILTMIQINQVQLKKNKLV